jgi:hypothetical protein
MGLIWDPHQQRQNIIISNNYLKMFQNLDIWEQHQQI